MKFLVCAILVILLVTLVRGRKFTHCEMAQELYYKHNFPRESLADWVCLIEFESSFVTTVVGGPNSNGSSDWGLFQVNDNYWCVIGAPGKDCNVDCNKLIDDDITDDVACARIIYARHGFTAWNGWKSKCQGEIPNFDECFENEV